MSNKKGSTKSYVAPHQNYERQIRTVFTDHTGEIVKTNRSIHVGAAVEKALGYLQTDHYLDARTVEVYDDESGVVHAVLGWKDQAIVVHYKRDPRLFR